MVWWNESEKILFIVQQLPVPLYILINVFQIQLYKMLRVEKLIKKFEILS